MGVVPLLILVNKMNALSASLPPSSTNNMEQYMLSVMGLLCLHLLEFAVVNFALRRERELNAAKGGNCDSVGDYAAHAPGRMKSVLRCMDRFAADHLRWNLNVHTRWVSVVIFCILTIMLLSG